MSNLFLGENDEKSLMKERLTPNSPAEKRVLVFSAIIALAVLVSDFLTKIWVIRCFKLHESVELIPGLLAFTSVRNYGAAWSILSGHVWLLFAFAVVAAVLLVVFFPLLFFVSIWSFIHYLFLFF